MIGPCELCKYWHHRNKVHHGWGHCFRAQEMTDEDYSKKSPDIKNGKMVAIGDEVGGMFATEKSFECNEFRPIIK